MKFGLPRLLLLALYLFMAVAPRAAVPADEGILSKLLAPGPLMKGHDDLEDTSCLKCHDAGKGVPDSKCLACHKEIRPFVESHKGYHGLVTKSCRECHSDHKGRDLDTVKVDEKTFDHGKLTGYKLEGKHGELKCIECHKERRDRKAVRPKDTHYFGKTTTCVSCHRKDDVHYFKGQWAKKDCNACHGLKSWKEDIVFDHERDAKFKLEGKHEDLACAKCHTVDKAKHIVRYQWAKLKSDKCLSCHVNVHIGKMTARFAGGKCVTCHSQDEWKIPHFDHSVTKYPLRQSHAQLKCVECHKQKPSIVAEKSNKNWMWKGLSSRCLSCHDDFHKFGKHEMRKFAPLNKCASCHNERKWKDIRDFDHNVDTRYALDGKHLDLKCAECHLTRNSKAKPVVWINPGIYKWRELTAKTCETCHANPHIGKFSKETLKQACNKCHVTESWTVMKGKQSFDHSKTRFALTGAHRAASCDDCHLVNGKRSYRFSGYYQAFCLDCHKNVHTGMFSADRSDQKCTACHTTEGFVKRLDFDHGKTRMPLNGAHAKLKCESCHMPTTTKFNLVSPDVAKKKFPGGKLFVHSKYIFKGLESEKCLNCHADVHVKQVGRDCLKCHTENEWKIANFDHTRLTSYELLFKHKEVACKDCHKPIPDMKVKEFRRNITVIKYDVKYDQCSTCHKDPHKGGFGANCAGCHTEKGWKVTKDFHKNFTLSGIHFSLACNECHKDQRRLAGLSQQCISCHAKDDVHFGSLPLCQDCHRQQFWDIVTSFKHSMSQFPLRGAHRTLDCVECHKSGVYQGLNSECFSCHMQDALSATSRVHSAADTDCTQCHRNQFSFRSAP